MLSRNDVLTWFNGLLDGTRSRDDASDWAVDHYEEAEQLGDESLLSAVEVLIGSNTPYPERLDGGVYFFEKEELREIWLELISQARAEKAQGDLQQ